MAATVDVMVIGGGLAGYAAALAAEKAGASVLLIEKEAKTGGNSAKASSGINGTVTPAQIAMEITDSIDVFAKDTMWSAVRSADAPVTDAVKVLTSSSADAVAWLCELGVDLSIVSRCGGHTNARTHRPASGAPVGFAIMSKVQAQAKEKAKIEVRTGTGVTELRKEGVAILADGTELRAKTIILTTGGFGANQSMISRLRPDLAGIPTTNGAWTLGEGVALAEGLGAQTIDMDQIQVHPTGFVDPQKPEEGTKILAAECLRASGAILINKQGHRFVYELGLREEVVAAMNNAEGPFRLVLSKAQALERCNMHAVFYQKVGLLREYANAADLATACSLDVVSFVNAIDAYTAKNDAYGTKEWPGAPLSANEALLCGEVCPVVHYTMGGIRTDASARVLGGDGQPLPGLFAAGEVTGGLHGKNRLAGNSLLETVVFGRIAGSAAAAMALGSAEVYRF